MKRALPFFAVLILLMSCQVDESPGSSQSGESTQKDLSVTVGVGHISAVGVELKGKANIGSTVASDLMVGFQYSKSAGILPSNSTTIEAIDADVNYNYSASITGLEPETTYYFRSFVRQRGEDSFGVTKEFTTKGLSSMLETLDATDINPRSVSLNAKLDLTDVKYNKLSYGFYIGRIKDSLADDIKCENHNNKEYSSSLAYLSPETQYWYRAYLSLDDQSYLGDIKSFTTTPVQYRYLTFISTGTTTIELVPEDDWYSSQVDKSREFYYSTDKITWKKWDYSALTFTSSQPLYICGNNPKGINDFQKHYGQSLCFKDSGSDYKVTGSIMSLIDMENDLTKIPSDYCFIYLFKDCCGLISAPSLPATTLGYFCYGAMFAGCVGLTSAPELPATSLKEGCYASMFAGCVGLTSAPELPATQLVRYSYRGMFENCSKLSFVKCLAKDISAEECVDSWLSGVASTGTFVKAPDMNDWPSGENGIPKGWVVQ